MIKMLIPIIFLWAVPLAAQSPREFFGQIKGLWKQQPPKGIDPVLIEESFFEFRPDGMIIVSINGGTEEAPLMAETGRGKISLLKEGNPLTVEIILNEEYSTNALILKNQVLTIFSFHEKTGRPIEKLVLQKVARS